MGGINDSGGTMPDTADSRERADSLAVKDPPRYRELVDAIRAGEPQRAICKRLHTSMATIAQTLKREGLPAWKQRTSDDLAAFISEGSNRLREEVNKIPIGQLPVAVAVAIDKKAMLDGDTAPTVVEHRHLNLNLSASLADLRAQMHGSQAVATHAGPPVVEAEVATIQPPADAKAAKPGETPQPVVGGHNITSQ